MGLTDTLVPYAGAAPSFAAWRDKDGCDSAGVAPEVNESYGGSDCAIDTSCGGPDIAVGLCSVTGSTFDPPFDVFDGHILYINDDAFDVSQRAWDFMAGATPPIVPTLRVSHVVLLAATLAFSGAAALTYRSRMTSGRTR